jgi:hypothetical protein
MPPRRHDKRPARLRSSSASSGRDLTPLSNQRGAPAGSGPCTRPDACRPWAIMGPGHWSIMHPPRAPPAPLWQTPPHAHTRSARRSRHVCADPPPARAPPPATACAPTRLRTAHTGRWRRGGPVPIAPWPRTWSHIVPHARVRHTGAPRRPHCNTGARRRTGTRELAAWRGGSGLWGLGASSWQQRAAGSSGARQGMLRSGWLFG